jgi:hypothetical protein
MTEIGARRKRKNFRARIANKKKRLSSIESIP